MIVWSGWGFLTVVFAIAGGALGTALGVALGGPEDGANLGTALGLASAALAIWALGQRLNRRVPGYHPGTGQPVLYGNQHRLFFVPMQYWGPLVGLAAVVAAGTALLG